MSKTINVKFACDFCPVWVEVEGTDDPDALPHGFVHTEVIVNRTSTKHYPQLRYHNHACPSCAEKLVTRTFLDDGKDPTLRVDYDKLETEHAKVCLELLNLRNEIAGQ